LFTPLANNLTIQNLTLLKWTDSNGQDHSLKLKNAISPKWREVGDLLGVDSSRLDGIHMHRGGDVQLCCRDVLLEWLQMKETSYSVNWEGFLVLLKDIELNSTAMKLQEALTYIEKHN